MNAASQQSLQEFFDSPLAMAARYKLSASACEPVSMSELLALEPDAAEGLTSLVLDYPARYAPDGIIEKIAARYPGLDPSAVMVTSGVDEGLGMLFLTQVDPGDRVVVLTPCYPPHLDLPRWRGAETVQWRAREENDWVPDLDELRELTREKTRLVVATFPQNPTGFMPDEDFLVEFTAILRESGATLLSDEIYAGLPLGGLGAPDMACRYEKAVILDGLSKTFALPGLRVGWLATRDARIIDGLKRTKMLFNCYLPGPVEHLTALALRHEPELLQRNNEILSTGIATADAFFQRHGNLFAWDPPKGGVVTFPRWLGPGGTKALSDRLLEEASTALAPSLCFDAGDAHFRLGLCRATFPAALAQFDEFLSRKL